MKFIESPAAAPGSVAGREPIIMFRVGGAAGSAMMGAEPKLDGTIPPRCQVTKYGLRSVLVRWWWALEGGRVWYSAGYTRVSRVRYELISARAWMRVKLEHLLRAGHVKPPAEPIPTARTVQR